jgi:hypothetical protein
MVKAVGFAQSLGSARAPSGFAARVLKRVRRDRRGVLSRGLAQKVPYEGGIVLILASAAAALLLAYGLHSHGGLFAKNDGPPRAPAPAPRR